MRCCKGKEEKTQSFREGSVSFSGLSKRAFTLVELMIASAILVTLMVAYLGTYHPLLKNTQQNKSFALAMTACLNKINEISAYDFSLVPRDYSSTGTPGDTFNLSGFASGDGAGKITITDRPDLYGGGCQQATSSANWGNRRGHTSLVYDNKMWVLGGITGSFSLKNDVWYSTDGATWTQATASAGWSPRWHHTSLVYDNKMWVLGGEGSLGRYNDVWYSTDGATWTEAKPNDASGWSGRCGHTSLVYDNKMWVLGGISSSDFLNDVWYSTDGINWTEVTTNPPVWPARCDHTSLVYDNKMWVLGGNASYNARNDVWYSTDGATWTQAKPNDGNGWSRRWCHTSLVYDNKMWVLGGGGSSYWNDIWYSTDGATWTQATANASWSKRREFTSLVYDNKMWVLGGFNGAGISDVWSSTAYNRLLEVVIRAGFKTPEGRIIGASDTNNNGTIEPDEVNSDTPVQIRGFIAEKRKEAFLGQP